MTFLLLAAAAVTQGSFESTGYGELFPEFDVGAHCQAMKVSSSSKIRHLAESCEADETHYRNLAVKAWEIASVSSRTTCEIFGLRALGSYSVLVSCLNSETAIELLLGRSQRSQH